MEKLRKIVQAQLKKAKPATQPITMTFDTLIPAIQTGRAMQTSAYCIRCHKKCSYASAAVHWAGTPCVDFSNFGLRQEENGRAAVFLCAWLGMRLELQEPVIIHENVAQFNCDLLSSILGHLYNLTTHVTNAADFGWPVSRVRRPYHHWVCE